MTPDEYVLRLRTGEVLQISEFAHERIPELMEAVSSLGELLRGCTVLTRAVIEAAKRGDDTGLCKALRDPLSGMLRMLEPFCSQRGNCAMFDRDVCTARNRSSRKPVPVCYESSSGQLASAIVLAGAAGRRVVIVVPETQALRAAPA